MDMEHDFDQALAGWQQSLLRMEAAVQAADWPGACRMVKENGTQFDRLKVLLDQMAMPRSDSRMIGIREGLATLQRLTGLFEAWQAEFKTEIRNRRRALQTAKAYHPATVSGPRHLRVYAGNPIVR
jgi:hypothetical protein